jgi:hypothetical protein
MNVAAAALGTPYNAFGTAAVAPAFTAYRPPVYLRPYTLASRSGRDRR